MVGTSLPQRNPKIGQDFEWVGPTNQRLIDVPAFVTYGKPGCYRHIPCDGDGGPTITGRKECVVDGIASLLAAGAALLGEVD